MKAKIALGVCLLLASSLVFSQERIRVVNEGGIADAWGLAAGTSLASPTYPAAYAGDQKEVCVAVGYLLHPDGTTSDFSLLKSWAEDPPRRGADAYWAAFATSASNALANWRFVPRPEVMNPRPVYSMATFLFGAKDADALHERCAVPDLAYRIFELQHERKAARRMAGNELFSRLDIDTEAQRRHQRDMQERLDLARDNQEERDRQRQRAIERSQMQSQGGQNPNPQPPPSGN